MRGMLISLISTILASFRTRLALQTEILALRHQIIVLRRSVASRPKLQAWDRFLWIWLLRLWPEWRSALIIVKPETVIAWHRKAFRLFWTRKSRRGRSGRPRITRDVRELIRTISKANSLWGAPRIHAELLKLGIVVSQATVAKYMVRYPKPPSQTWRTFLNNHTTQLASIDIFTVPTISSAFSTSSWFSHMSVAASFTSTLRLIQPQTGPRSSFFRPFLMTPFRNTFSGIETESMAKMFNGN